jgi:uncharacterized paraquat-inducible protein A
MLLKIKTFLISLYWHINRGMPKSSQQEIDRRFSICVSCKYYNKQEQECGVCGCNINRRKIFMNKLAWADQKCPEQKW